MNKLVNYSEEDVISKCLENNRKFQEILFKKYYGRVMDICLKYTRDKDKANEYHQEAFVKIFKNLNKYRHNGSFEGFISILTKNNILDSLRRSKKYNFIQLNENVIEDNHYLNEIEEYTERRIDFINLKSIFHKLPKKQRIAIDMYLENKGHEEISKELNINIGTSKSNLFKAKAKLREMVKKEEFILLSEEY